MKPTLAAVQSRLGIPPTAREVERHVHDWRLRSGLLRGSGEGGNASSRMHVVYRCQTCGASKNEIVDPLFTERPERCPTCAERSGS